MARRRPDRLSWAPFFPLSPIPHVTDTLDPQPWMNAPATRAVIEALELKGGRGCARFVGGCVRNAVLGREIDDIDIATTLTPNEATAALEARSLKVAPTGVEHGTVTAVSDHRPFEITTLRRDVSTDGRRAVVAFTTDWAEDAMRRDFRLNALYLDTDGRLYDPTGEGLADAKAGRIVFVGDPMVRIREDYLRILRFFRFLAWFGRGEPDTAALQACRALKGMLSGRSAASSAVFTSCGIMAASLSSASISPRPASTSIRPSRRFRSFTNGRQAESTLVAAISRSDRRGSLAARSFSTSFWVRSAERPESMPLSARQACSAAVSGSPRPNQARKRKNLRMRR